MAQGTLSRRAVLQGTAGLVIGLYLSGGSGRAESGAAQAFRPGAASGALAPNAFVRVGADDTVTVLIKHIEFGQGPFTGLATLVAEEIDADWSQIRAEHAPSDPDLYKNLAFGIQGTGGYIAGAFQADTDSAGDPQGHRRGVRQRRGARRRADVHPSLRESA